MATDPLEELHRFFRERDYPFPFPAVRHSMQVSISGKRRFKRFVVEYETSATPYLAGSAHVMLYDWGSLVKVKRMSGVKPDEAVFEFDKLSNIVRKIPQDTPSWQIKKMVQ